MGYIHPSYRRYHSDFSTTDRWLGYENRSNDVFVCTPPKCGTTWTMSIVAMLCQGTTNVIPTDVVHWIEANVVPIEEVTQTLTEQRHQRCIKSHTPFDGVPWFKSAHYIAVYRHPLDMLFSIRKHTQNTKDIDADHPYIGTIGKSLKHFVEKETNFDDFEDSTLEAFLIHYCSYIKMPRPDNLLLLHYSDMLIDARATIDRIAQHIGVESNPDFLDAVFEATSFKNMQSRASRFAPFATKGFWHDPKAFFDSATSNKWVDKITDAQFGNYRDKVASFLNAEEIAWLENGAIASGISFDI